MSNVTPIGIAIVEHNGNFLVGTRGEDVALAGYAEFPGGKCKPDEGAADCACRECFEETGIEVEAIEQFDRLTFTYEHGTVDLSFWLCRPKSSTEAQPPFEWVNAPELGKRRFPEANHSVIERLIARDI